MSVTRSRAHDFFRETVEPTVNEFLADKINIRRGRLASIVLSHMVDYWCADHNIHNKSGLKSIRDELIAHWKDKKGSFSLYVDSQITTIHLH